MAVPRAFRCTAGIPRVALAITFAVGAATVLGPAGRDIGRGCGIAGAP